MPLQDALPSDSWCPSTVNTNKFFCPIAHKPIKPQYNNHISAELKTYKEGSIQGSTEVVKCYPRHISLIFIFVRSQIMQHSNWLPIWQYTCSGHTWEQHSKFTLFEWISKEGFGISFWLQLNCAGLPPGQHNSFCEGVTVLMTSETPKQASSKPTGG